jgi:N-acetylmuramoyl-L-alanine amidase
MSAARHRAHPPPARRLTAAGPGAAAVAIAVAAITAVAALLGAGRPAAGEPPARRSAAAALSAAEVKQAQQRLVELGYWAGTAGGRWDATWRQALIAFQKMEWRKRTGVLTRAEWSEILRAAPPVPRETGPAHIEVDLARQVFYMVDDAGALSHILPVSSGSGKPFRAPAGWRATADTPCGHFTVFSRGYGWHHSELGEMYNPLYLVGGIAIHGSLDVPPNPASHGCIRVPMYAAHRLPKLVPREMPVLVYGCKDEAPAPLPATARR